MAASQPVAGPGDLPLDFMSGSPEFKNCLTAEYDDEGEEDASPPQPFEYDDCHYVDLDADNEERDVFDDGVAHDDSDHGDHNPDRYDAFDIDAGEEGAAGFSPAAEFVEILAEQGPPWGAISQSW